MSQTNDFTPTKITDKQQWGALKRHDITLPSGASVVIEIPNLADLMETGQIPNDLLDVAIQVAKDQQVKPEHVSKQADFYRQVVLASVVEPEGLTEDDLKPGGVVPYEDIELIAEIATRQRDVDAVGNHIAGLDRSAAWRRFRGLDFGE